VSDVDPDAPDADGSRDADAEPNRAADAEPDAEPNRAADAEPDADGDRTGAGTGTETAAGATAWERTVAEMEALASRRAADGWETVTLRAADTTPEPPDVGDADRFGLVYTVPDGAADEFRAAFAAGTFDRFTVHRRRVGDVEFLVTEVRDEAAAVAVLVAGAFDASAAEAVEVAARDASAMYSHVQLLDWTHLGSFRHDDPDAFFGDAEPTAGDG
jgi:hypothetical protein